MSYRTKQRELLLDFFAKHHDQSFSAEEIAVAVKKQGISLSAVYRNLNELEINGKVRKISKTGSRKAYYQFVDLDFCKDSLHLSCTHCGKTTHMNKCDADALANILSNSHFNIDKQSTVLYGVCEKCKK